MSVYLVGEIASTHHGSWERVETLVTLCAQAGFSACKLQYWSDADRLADRRHATDAYRAIYRRYSIPISWLQAFHALCHSHGLEAVVTCYLPEDVAIVAEFADRIKVAAFESADDALVALAMQTGKPVIVSCGLGGPENDRHHGPGCDYLACVSAYPAPLDGALAVFVGDSDRYFEGYSDHTHNLWTGAVAVGMGAQIIEVHVRAYDTSPMNPDYATALDPREFRLYAEGVRTAERLIADVPVDESAMRRFKVRAE